MSLDVVSIAQGKLMTYFVYLLTISIPLTKYLNKYSENRTFLMQCRFY